MLRPQTRSNRTETLCPYKTRFRSDAGLLALLPAAEAVAKHAGAVGLAVLRAAEHRAEHAADVAAGMVLLQRAEQRLRAFGLAGVAAQRAHQQRQRGADGGRGLGGIDAQLLRDLLERCALEIGRAHVWTPVTNAHLVCRLLLEKKKTTTYIERI